MDPFLGEIRLFAGNYAPKGWALCQGQLLAITQYAALFSLLGVNYGGNGTSNFGLPDLRGRVPIGIGQGQGLSPYVQGEEAGVETVTLGLATMGSHTHAVNAVGANGDQTVPAGYLPAQFPAEHGKGINAYAPHNSTLTSMSGSSIPNSGGGATPHVNMQPTLVLNYIIALTGAFPQRP